MQLNSIAENLKTWQDYDWRDKGKEWVLSLDWKNSFVTEIILPYFKREAVTLQIGSGFGEWSSNLLYFSSRLILTDILTEGLEDCKRKFASYDHIEYLLSDGKHLDAIEDESIDQIFTIQCFVLCDYQTVEAYLSEFSRVLVKGGIAVIHHSNTTTYRDLYSDMPAERFLQLLEKNNFELILQTNNWNNGRHELLYADVEAISIVRK